MTKKQDKTYIDRILETTNIQRDDLIFAEIIRILWEEEFTEEDTDIFLANDLLEFIKLLKVATKK